MDGPDPDEFIARLEQLQRWLVFCDIPHDLLDGDPCLRTRDGRLIVRTRPPHIVLDGDAATFAQARDVVNDMAQARMAREIFESLSRWN